MSLGPGSTIGPFKIQSLLGKGGMGEVFSALDTRLDRKVALKILPPDFASDAGRLRRFQSEAKTLASLNHPNILSIFEVGAENGTPYLVSELLEGRTLREELGARPLPLRKVIDYALQIANGLAAAHTRGIIHRDLKPENIFITKDGRAKILDFGLAKSAPVGGTRDANPSPSDEDALTVVATTTPGLVLGTPAYMSPEQVRGEPADHRSDVFSFGCVLYEMLTGSRPFRRNTAVETMNAVLNEEIAGISSDALSNISPALQRVVLRCLDKQPHRRFQSADDLSFAIANIEGSSATSTQPSVRGSAFDFRRLLPWALTGVSVLALSFLLATLPARLRRDSSSQPNAMSVRKFEMLLPAPQRTIGNGDQVHPAISPDGQKLAFSNADGLWLRWLDRAAPPVRIASGENITCPFWSPDSLNVGYFEGRKIHRVSINGGQQRLICTAPDYVGSGAAGGAWLSEDQIVFGTGWKGLYRVPAEGGKFREVHRTSDDETDFHNPSALPGGRGVLLTVHRTAGIDTIAVWTEKEGRKQLLQMQGAILFYPVYSSTGHILFQRSDEAGGIWAFPFSLERMERTDEPFRVSDTGSLPSVSNDGTLVFSLLTLDEFAPRQLAWIDPKGRILQSFGPTLAGLSQPQISPDGRHILVAAGESASGLDVWVIDSANGGAIVGARTEELEASPFWFDQGRSIAFTRRQGSNSAVFTKALDSPEESRLFDSLQVQTGSANFAVHLSPGGTYFFAGRASPSGKIAVGYFAIRDPEKKFLPLPEAYQQSSHWCLSGDESLLAYQSGETGQNEVYVVPFPAFSGRQIVSRDGGRHPLWHPDGKKLFYVTIDGRALMSAELAAGGQSFAEPAKLFDLPESIHPGFVWWPPFYSVAPDGEKFLMARRAAKPAELFQPNVLLVQNWAKEFAPSK